MMQPEAWVIVIAVAAWCGIRCAQRILRHGGADPNADERRRSKLSHEVSRTLRTCPACRSSLRGHLFWDPISVVLPDDDTATRIADLVRRHVWCQLNDVRIFTPERDALMYWIIQCPQTRKTVLYEVHSKAGFDDEDRVDLLEAIGESEAAEMVRDLNLGARPALTLQK